MADYDLDFGGDSDGEDGNLGKNDYENGIVSGEEENVKGPYVEEGVIFEPFNMTNERNDGRIDRDGHYIENRNWSDAWLDEVEAEEKSNEKEPGKYKKFKLQNSTAKAKKESEMMEDQDDDEDDDDDDFHDVEKRKKSNNLTEGGDTDDDEAILSKEVTNAAASKSSLGMKRKTKSRSAADIQEENDLAEEKIRTNIDKNVLISQLVSLLKPGETVIAAMKRTGKTIVNKKEKNPDLDHLTELADTLLGSGMLNIYYETLESLIALKDSAVVKDKPTQIGTNSNAKLWQYKASSAGEIFGPFNGEEMQAWMTAGYLAGDVCVRPYDSYTDDDDPFILLSSRPNLSFL